MPPRLTRHLHLTLLLLLAAPLSARAAAPQAWPLALTLRDEATGVPGYGGGMIFAGPVHPGVRLGTEYAWHDGSRFRALQTLALSFAVGPVARTASVSTEGRVAVRTVGALWLEAGLGLGYGWGVSVMPLFTPGGERLPGGSGGVRVALKAGLSWRFASGPELFAEYEAGLTVPLRGDLQLPVSALGVGVRVPLATVGGAL